MLTYHQCGHNYIWNINSLVSDGAGDGLIISPVNIEADKISEKVSLGIRKSSWIDPQFYLPHDNKNKLATYPFFPGNVLPEFTTEDFETHAATVATECAAFQDALELAYVVAPTRHFDDLPEGYLEQLGGLFVQPFIDAKAQLGIARPLLITVIVKPVHLEFGIQRDELLSWCTSFEGVAGVYLIFENDFYSKQIKDAAYIAGQLRFIHALRLNGLEVHVGYSGLEGLVLSIADPTSVSMGSYDNLRSFGTLRLETRDRETQRGPRPRIYSGHLLQSIDNTVVPALRELVPEWVELFEPSPYRSYLLENAERLNFQRSELYKHYFWVFSKQVREMPRQQERAEYWRGHAMSAISRFDALRQAGIYLDSDSDQSHLPGWLNAISMFNARPE